MIKRRGTLRGNALALAVIGFVTHAAAQTSPSVPLLTTQTSSTSVASSTRGLGSRAGLRLSRGVQQVTALGATVAVLDTGINTHHVTFDGRLAPGAYEVFGGTANVSDISWHGTAVASIIAQARDPSGAFADPRILAVRVFDGPTAWDGSLNAGIQYSISRAPIANLSFAAPSPIAEAGIREAVAARQLVVVAAGNRGAAHPDWPARFAREPWANGQVIAVGAVDAANQIASFSNRAGDTRAFFLVAPGVGVAGASSQGTNGWVSVSGTSLAAPVVSAGAALIHAQWPYLSAAQIANILFSTATDLGAPGVDDVYGHGKVDVARALLPVGQTVVPLASGRAVPLSAASLDAGLIAGPALRAASLAGAMQGIALDGFGRRYYYDFGQGLAQGPRLTPDQIFGGVERSIGFTRTRTASGARVLIGADRPVARHALGALHAYEARERLPSMLAGVAIVQPFGASGEIAFGSRGMAGTYFGLNATDAAGDVRLAPPLFGITQSLPYLTLAGAHHHLASGYGFDGGVKIKAGVIGTSASDAKAAVLDFAPGGRTPSTQGMVVELSRQGELGAFGVVGQQLRERATHFGMLGGEAYRLSTAPVTTALTVFGRLELARHWTLAGQYSVGATPAVTNTSDSIIARYGAMRSDAFTLGLFRHEVLRSGDRLSLSVSQPLRAQSGAITLDLPAEVDASGQVVRSPTTIGLNGVGRELLTELAYSFALTKNAAFGVSYLYRRQPNHERSAPAERVLGARVELSW